MDFTGIVYKILDPISGTSARGEWKKQDVIFELPGEFNRKLCVSFWGDNVAKISSFKQGDKLTVSTNIESRESNGRWYTDVRAWRVTRPLSSTVDTPDEQSMPPIEESEFEPDTTNDSTTDDLPF